IKAVYSEVNFKPDTVGQTYFTQVHEFLMQYGFTLSGFYEAFRFGTSRQHIGFANALWLHSSTAE
ncbi:MAG: hypothetical protein AAFY98_12105, partial [Verrucomicrobiota bacterium]